MNQKVFSYLDWAGSLGSLGYGVYSGSLWWGVGGALGLIVAYFNPAKRFAAKLTPKRPILAVKPLPEEGSQSQTAPALAGAATLEHPRARVVTFASPTTPKTYGPTRLSPSKHNGLSAAVFNSYTPTELRTPTEYR